MGKAGDGGEAVSSPHRHDPLQGSAQFVDERHDSAFLGRRREELAVFAVAPASLADQRGHFHCWIAADLQDHGSDLVFADRLNSLAGELERRLRTVVVEVTAIDYETVGVAVWREPVIKLAGVSD